jgi:hypothetical protein
MPVTALDPNTALLVIDLQKGSAMSDRSAEAHANSISGIFHGLGETGTSWEITDLLGRTRA